jgi:hypothetical protein
MERDRDTLSDIAAPGILRLNARSNLLGSSRFWSGYSERVEDSSPRLPDARADRVFFFTGVSQRQ